MSEIYERLEVVALWNAGFSYAQIEEQTGKKRSYVRRWVRRHRDAGSVERKTGSGRPSKLTPEVLATVWSRVKLIGPIGEVSYEIKTVWLDTTC